MPGCLYQQLDERSRAPADYSDIGRDMYILADVIIEVHFRILPDIFTAGKGGEIRYLAEEKYIKIVEAASYKS